MRPAPQWHAVDERTADVLALTGDVDHPSGAYEWEAFLAALNHCAEVDGGLVYPNRLRPLVRGRVAPRRIGAFTNRAIRSRLVAYTGEWQISDDHESGNAGKPCRVMRRLPDPPAPASPDRRGA